MKLTFDPNSIDDYRQFLAVKQLPKFKFTGRTVEFPDEYATRLGMTTTVQAAVRYKPSKFCFDYQGGIAKIAINKRKYAAFVDCGYGKTIIEGEFGLAAAADVGSRKHVLFIAPLMVIGQTVDEFRKFYGKRLPVEQVAAKDLNARLASDKASILITNYDALTDEIQPGNLGALIPDESSMMKSAYGKWANTILRIGKGLHWKLCATGTPAPNDRIEYANHAVFLDAEPTVNSFLAKYFINRGQTDNRWELKAHAVDAFYRDLSHWSIFMTNPATYGWKDNVGTIPPIRVHIQDVGLTQQQQDLVFTQTGTLFADQVGGITSRSVLSQIAKGNYKGESVDTLKPGFIRDLVESWPTESTLIWCRYNAEQELMGKTFPDAGNITGDTPIDERLRIIAAFKAGQIKRLITKGKILGFGQNLQIATRHVFSTLHDSYEEYYQCVKRSNRVGSTVDLNVHIPITDIERPMVQTVLTKAKRVQEDAIAQEKLFRRFVDAA